MINNEYKNTELGLLPDDWKIICLGDINTEKNQNISPLKDEIYEYYSIPAYQENNKPEIVKGSTILSQKKILKENMILFGKLNPRVEKVWKVGNYSNYKKIGSGEWITIFPNPYEVSAEYLFYLELSKFVMPIAKTLVTGSTPSRQRVDPKSFYKLKVPLPPLKEQQKIAYVLSAVKQTQEKTLRIINSLKELKKSTMKHLFNYGITSLEDINDIKLKEIEGIKIPHNWETKAVTDIYEFSNKPRDVRIKDNDQVPFIAMEDISEYYKTAHYQIKPYEKIASGTFVNKNDLIVSKITPCFENGKQALLTNLPAEFGFATTEVIPLHPRDTDKVIAEHLYNYLKIPEVRNLLIGKMQGTTGRKRLPKDALANLKIPIPSLEEQQQIAKILSSIEIKIEVEENRRVSLEQLFKSLLSNLMSAKIRVNSLKVS